MITAKILTKKNVVSAADDSLVFRVFIRPFSLLIAVVFMITSLCHGKFITIMAVFVMLVNFFVLFYYERSIFLLTLLSDVGDVFCSRMG